MTDARLVATNPADSTLVPVACTPQGFIKTESPFDPGVITGDLTVSGNASIGTNLDVTGTATFSSDVFLGTATVFDTGKAEFQNQVKVFASTSSALNISRSVAAQPTTPVFRVANDTDTNIIFYTDGGAKFSNGGFKIWGSVADAGYGACDLVSTGGAFFSGSVNSDSYISAKGAPNNSGSTVFQAYNIDGVTNPITTTITAAGNATFTGNVTAANINAANLTAFKNVLASGITAVNAMEDVKQLLLDAIALL